MTNYKRGVETERKIMECLEAEGYIPFRMAGSHGIFDVGGIGPTGVRFIQSKRCKKKTGWEADYRKAKEAMEILPRLPGVSYEIWVWVDYKGFLLREVV